MGFLSFLGRKPPTDAITLRAQAYHNTTASAAPTRGNAPIAGNGPNSLDELQRMAKRRELDHASIASTSSAPAPPIPRLRTKSMGRPGTSDGNSPLARPKSAGNHSRSGTVGTVGGPTLGKKYGPYRVYKDGDDVPLPTVPPVPTIPQFAIRDSSLDGPSKRKSNYVDLLDAQSDIKPSSFQLRLRAGGARDYGEDVADRNILPDNASIASPCLPPTSRPHSRLSSNGGRDESIGQGGSPNPDRFGHKQTPSHMTQHDSTIRGRNAHNRLTEEAFVERRLSGSQRRRSVGEFTSSDANNNKRSKPRPLSLHPSLSNFQPRSSSPPSIRTSRPRTAPNNEISRINNAYQPIVPTIAIKEMSDERPRAKSVGTQAFHRSKGHQNGAGRKKAKGRGHLQHEAAYADSELTDEESSSSGPSLKTSRASSRSTRAVDQKSRKKPSSHSRSDTAGSQSRPSTASSHSTYPRNRSLGGASLQSQLDDIIEHIPARKSSLSPWTGAESPTTASSVQSSTAMFSPQRGTHTAATSIDGNYVPPVKNDHSRTKSGTSAYSKRLSGSSAYATALEDQRFDRPVSREGKTKRDTIESFISSHMSATDELHTTDGSDVEAFLAKRQMRQPRDDERLIFKDGAFVQMGDNLPGLFDGLQSTDTSSNMPETPTTPRAAGRSDGGAAPRLQPYQSSSPAQKKSFAYPNRRTHPRAPEPSLPKMPNLSYSKPLPAPPSFKPSRPTHRRVPDSLSSARSRGNYGYGYSSNEAAGHLNDNNDDDDDDDEEGEDYGASRERAVRILATMKAQNIDILDLFDIEESEREKADVRAALRLRKEMKRLQRLDASLGRGMQIA